MFQISLSDFDKQEQNNWFGRTPKQFSLPKIETYGRQNFCIKFNRHKNHVRDRKLKFNVVIPVNNCDSVKKLLFKQAGVG